MSFKGIVDSNLQINCGVAAMTLYNTSPTNDPSYGAIKYRDEDTYGYLQSKQALPDDAGDLENAIRQVYGDDIDVSDYIEPKKWYKLIDGGDGGFVFEKRDGFCIRHSVMAADWCVISYIERQYAYNPVVVLNYLFNEKYQEDLGSKIYYSSLAMFDFNTDLTNEEIILGSIKFQPIPETAVFVSKNLFQQDGIDDVLDYLPKEKDKGHLGANSRYFYAPNGIDALGLPIGN